MSEPYDEDLWGFEDGFEDDPCDHDDEHVDVDILTWRAHCRRCGEAWWMTKSEMDAEMKFRCEQAEDEAREFIAAPSITTRKE